VAAVLVLQAVGPESALGLTEAQFGLLLTAFAIGGLAGTVVAAPLAARLGRARALTLAILGMAAYMWVFVVTTDVVAIGLVIAVAALAIMVWNVITVSFRQRVVPDRLLGRVNSAYRMVAWGTMPLGALLGGLLGQWFGVEAVFVVFGVATLAVLIPDRLITEEALAAAEAEAEAR
jgi:MFS family permease